MSSWVRDVMSKVYDLDRFLKAQAPVIADVRRELSDGKKRSHWMWFVFPQIAGLGQSPTARHYAIGSLPEAAAYAAHSVLGQRLVEMTELVNAIEGKSLDEIFGSPDDRKFHSSMTLFSIAAPKMTACHDALAKYFDGVPDQKTIELFTM